MPAEPYVATPRTTPTTSPPNPKLIAVEPGPIEPDEAEPAAAEPQPSTSPDKVGCLNLTPIMHGICRREKETESPHKQTNIILNILNSFIKKQLANSKLQVLERYTMVSLDIRIYQ